MAVRRPRRKAEETREDILAMAECLFRERGISHSSIADVAQALNMSPANVFKHFGSKAALTDIICDRHVSRMADRFGTLISAGAAPGRLEIAARKLMEAHLDDIRQNPFLVEMILLISETEQESGLHYRSLIENLFAEIIRDGVDSGVYRCADPEKTSRSVAAAFASVLHPVFLIGTDIDELRERCRGIAELVNAALQTPLAK